MALVKLSALVDNISGKVGSLVFSRTKGGLAVRQYNRFGPGNIEWLDDFKQFAQSAGVAWQFLTENQRLAWNQAAPNFPYQNRLGDKEQYSGNSLYLKLNFWLAFLELPLLQYPPKPPIEAKISNFRIAQFTQTKFTLRGNLELMDKRVYHIIRVSKPLNPGTMRTPNMFIISNTRRSSSGSFRIDLEDLYSARFPTLRSPKKVFVESFLVDEYSGVSYGHRIASAVL